MKVVKNYQSPNIHKIEIPIEFVTIHYTACDLQKTLEIFLDSNSKVSSHFVIDTNGDCYDMGNFFTGAILKGAHAGVSRFELDDIEYSSMNEISIGIELVNLNGNAFPYTDEQYESLAKLLLILKSRFPILEHSSRIIGHEHIAYWRGKADPGVRFDWDRLFHLIGLKATSVHNFHACNDVDLEFIESEISHNEGSSFECDFWPKLSSKLEMRINDRHKLT